jgi:hypothetical protein
MPKAEFPRMNLLGCSTPHGLTSVGYVQWLFVADCSLPATFLYNLLVNDPTYLVQNLTEYFSAMMCLVLTFLCWHLDRRGRANVITKASYVGLVGLLLVIMALPSIGL